MAQKLTANGHSIDSSSECFGRFRDSTALLGSSAALRLRLKSDGYLFIRNMVDTDVLRNIKSATIAELRRQGVIHSDRSHLSQSSARDIAGIYQEFPELGGQGLVRQIGRLNSLLQLFSGMFREPAKALDHVWVRAAGTGRGADPHCDWIYMSRGTGRLLTAWMPIDDVPIERGPLMVMEDSHRPNALLHRYLKMDSDRLGVLGGIRLKHGRLIRGGRYSGRPDKVQAEFGSRWLSEDFKTGDILIFGPTCLHATLDNQTSRFRLSVDVRFQPARDQMDPRFIGRNPPLHSGRTKSIFDHISHLRRRVTALVTKA